MKAGLISRLQRLEGRALVTSQPYTMRFGPLRRLPREYVGERHVAIVKQLPSDTAGHEWYAHKPASIHRGTVYACAIWISARTYP